MISVSTFAISGLKYDQLSNIYLLLNLRYRIKDLSQQDDCSLSILSLSVFH